MGITVSGAGEATGAPDLVVIDVGVSVLAGTVAEATSTATERGRAVVAALSSAGVAEADMKTTDYSIQPEYEYSDNKQRLLGYRVGNILRAKLREVLRTGEIVDAVSAAGGDHARVNGLRFAIEDESALQRAARQAAWEDARSKAQQLAELAGQNLGAATSITETVKGPVVPMPRLMAADMGMEKASTPIQGGVSSVWVNIEVEFRLGD
jgi:uncharacterized protein YggE